jgi:hypothetical protein
MTTKEAAGKLGISFQMVGLYARRIGIEPVKRFKAGDGGFKGLQQYLAFDFTEADLEAIRKERKKVLAGAHAKRAVVGKKNCAQFRPERHVSKGHLDRQNRIRQHSALLREDKDHWGKVRAYGIGPVVVLDDSVSSPLPGGPQMFQVQWNAFYPATELADDDRDLTKWRKATFIEADVERNDELVSLSEWASGRTAYEAWLWHERMRA